MRIRSRKAKKKKKALDVNKSTPALISVYKRKLEMRERWEAPGGPNSARGPALGR